jgi:hypothetical protein
MRKMEETSQELEEEKKKYGDVKREREERDRGQANKIAPKKT